MTDTIDTAQSDDEGTIELSAGWAAVRKGVVVAFIPVRKFFDVDMDQYRDQARALLASVGELKTGNLARKPDGSIVFLARRNHDRRSTQVGKPRPELPVSFLAPRPPAPPHAE